MQVHVAENRLKVIYPTLSKVSNIGFDEESTNTSGVNYLISPLDTGHQRKFNFSPSSNIVPYLQRQIKAPYAYKTLVIRKLRNEFIKLSGKIARVSK
jgi:hypothetical protein